MSEITDYESKLAQAVLDNNSSKIRFFQRIIKNLEKTQPTINAINEEIAEKVIDSQKEIQLAQKETKKVFGREISREENPFF